MWRDLRDEGARSATSGCRFRRIPARVPATAHGPGRAKMRYGTPPNPSTFCRPLWASLLSFEKENKFSPFFKGKQILPEGKPFYGGARGNLPYVRSPRFQRGEYGPAERKALSSALVGLKPSLNLLPLGPSKPPLPPLAVLGLRSLRFRLSEFAVPGTAG